MCYVVMLWSCDLMFVFSLVTVALCVGFNTVLNSPVV